MERCTKKQIPFGDAVSNSHTITLPETNSLHLKMDVWNTSRFLLGPGLFSGALAVSFREGINQIIALLRRFEDEARGNS